MLTYITAIRDALVGAEDWRTWIEKRLAEGGVTLRENEIVCKGSGVVGFYEFVSRDEAAQQFGSCPWFSLDPAPWVGGVAGFFSWIHVVDVETAQRLLIPQLVRHGRGVVAEPHHGRFLHVVRQKTFTLDNLVMKFGFTDGGALLFDQGPYVQYVIAAIDRRIAEAGFDGQANVHSTHHNPIRLARELLRNGVPVEDPEMALAPLTVDLWAYDWGVLDDDLFWIE